MTSKTDFPVQHDAWARCLQTAARSRDVGRLQKLWQRWRKNPNDEKQLHALQQAWDESLAWVQDRHQHCPELIYPDLPVSRQRAELVRLLATEPVLIIAGETGSGKTTQLPKMCLEAGRGRRGLIGHTQPRRLAARNVALRIAEELQSPLGTWVGCSMRFQDQTSDQNYIKVMTDGLLLAELRQDRWLSAYDTILIDEAHERSLNIDFLLGALQLLRRRRSDLHIVVTSATLQIERLADYFGQAPVIQVEGRTFPVDTLYLSPGHDRERSETPDTTHQDESEDGLDVQVRRAVERCLLEERRRGWGHGDLLVFLSTERELRDVHAYLRGIFANIDILPLYARLSAQEQQKVFAPHSQRRIILATNVAETSVTVPGIRYVIDAGKARISRYSYRNKVQRLPIEPIAQASAEQRKGRAGRTAPGLCIRLYSEQDFLQRPEFTDPEILRTHLAAVILHMLDLDLGTVEDFPWLDAPDERSIKDGYRLLEELGAISATRTLNETGRELARWPIDPQLARVMLTARQLGCLREALVVVSALAVQDPRERPAEHATLADQRHALFSGDGADIHFFLRLWQHVHAHWPDWSERQRRQFARQHFLSWPRLLEWREMYRQLLMECEHRQWSCSTEDASYESLALALLSGFPTQVAKRQEQRHYLGARGQKAWLHPGSQLAKKPVEWVLALEWVETEKLYLRMVLRVEPDWIERQSAHLLKRSYRDPHWERRQGRAMVLEQVALFGLVLHAGRAIPLANQDPVEARRLLLLEGLVRGDCDTTMPFLQQNRQLLQDVQDLEEKTRRRDWVVDEDELVRFYEERIPEDVVDLAGLQAWYRRQVRQQPNLLRMQREDVQSRHDGAIEEEFPDLWRTDSGSFALTYVFAPGDPRDGVTLTCPLGQYHSLPWQDLEHLVPGLRQEKISLLLRHLPKAIRRQLVPLPDLVERLNPSRNEPLLVALSRSVEQERGVRISPSDFDLEALPAHALMLIRVVDTEGRLLVEGRDRNQLDAAVQKLLGHDRPDSANHHSADKGRLLTRWPAHDVQAVIERGEGLKRLRLFGALQDHGQAVEWVEQPRPRLALQMHRRGCARLLVLDTLDLSRGYLQKIRKPAALSGLAQLGAAEALADGWVLAIVEHLACWKNQLPYDVASYRAGLSRVRSGMSERLQTGYDLLLQIAELSRKVRQHLGGLAVVLAPMRQDLEVQLHGLLGHDWLWDVGYERWQHYPRYLKAMLWRMERAGGQWQRDQQAMQDVQQRMARCQQVLDACERLQRDDVQAREYRWMLEEYRVFLFAQQLKTAQPVSSVRLDRFWSEQVEQRS